MKRSNLEVKVIEKAIRDLKHSTCQHDPAFDNSTVDFIYFVK